MRVRVREGRGGFGGRGEVMIVVVSEASKKSVRTDTLRLHGQNELAALIR